MILTDAIELGGDEGLELAKVLVLRNGDAGICWNDQPWFFTQVLRGVLAIGGDNIGSARAFVGLLAVGMLCASAKIVFGRVRPLTVLPVAFFWFLSPHILDVNLSVMLEIPAFSMMTIALAFARSYCESGRLRLLAVSGALVGIACQVKFVAAMFLPALVLMLIFHASSERREDGKTWPTIASRVFRDLWVVGVCSGIVFGVLIAFAPSWRWELLWGNHATASSSDPVLMDRNYEFSLNYLWYHEEAMIGGVVGVACLCARRNWLSLIPTVAMYVASVLIHLHHKPYWYFYYVHIAIPASMLSAYGLSTCLGTIFGRHGEARPDRSRLVAVSASISGAALLAGAAWVFGIPRFQTQMNSLRMTARVHDSHVVHAILENANGHKTLFSRRPIYYFHSGLSPIPDLALLVKKRFWSGGVSEQSVVARVISS